MLKTLKLTFSLMFFILGCATTDSGSIGLDEYESDAAGAAFITDAISIRRPMRSHADWKPWEFYYKSCSEIGEKYYYSKSAYDCVGPFY